MLHVAALIQLFAENLDHRSEGSSLCIHDHAAGFEGSVERIAKGERRWRGLLRTYDGVELSSMAAMSH